MNKVIAISENKEENGIIGLVVGEPFCELAMITLSGMGFKPLKQIKNTTIVQCDDFRPSMLNDFSMFSGLDYECFTFFACKKEEFKDMLLFIETEEN